MMLRVWSCRWGVARLAIALFIAVVLGLDAPARLARMQVSALPGFDYAAEANALRVQGKYGEAALVAQAGLDDPEAAAMHSALTDELAGITLERESFMRRLRDAGKGAVTGRGETLEEILGAVTADFFLVGDIRDIVIEGGKQLLDGESDEIILLLSVAGVFTTLAPGIDWAPSILKVARRTGAMSDRFAAWLRSSVRGGRSAEVAKACGDVATLSRAAGPGTAARLIALADGPDDLAKLARFAADNPTGAFALRTTGREGFAVIKGAGEAGETLVLQLARKGPAAREVLLSRAGRALLRPHPLLGVGKALWKGNAQKIITRALDRIDPNAWWALPLAAAWAAMEVALIIVRLRGRKASGGGHAGVAG
jgi:hypothetical protein